MNERTEKPAFSTTILVVEMANSGINWLEPRDLSMEQMPRTINAKTGQGISSKHHRRALAVSVDGSIQDLPEDMPPESLEARLTRDGPNPEPRTLNPEP